MDLYYLAYGSNLHPQRLLERVPSSKLVGSLLLDGYRLAFHKVGGDGSGKCNIIPSIVQDAFVYAALFTLSGDEKPFLDAYEGAGYYVDQLQLEWQGEQIRPFVYLAEEEYIDDSVPPFHWYKEIVSLGARHLDVPSHYISMIDSHHSVEDADTSRNDAHQQLIQRLKAW